MKMLLVHVTTILLTIMYTISCYGSKQELSEIDKFRYDLVTLEQILWNTIIDEQTNTISTNQSPQVELIQNYREFGDKLEAKLPHDVTYGVKPLENLWIWARTYGELRAVYALYETFRRFQRLQTDVGRIPSPKQAWLDLAETILQDSRSSVPDAMTKIKGFVQSERLFQRSLQEVIFEPCDVNQSPQQLLYHLYNSIALIQLKGYAMIQFSLQLLNLYNSKGNFSGESEIMRHRYEESAKITAEAAKMSIKQTKGDLWKCDPKVHIKGETYTELTQLLQAYIENEIDLSPSASCFKNCDYYDYARSNGCYKNGFCSKQTKCLGKVLNCRYIDSDMWVCPAEKGTGRRYEYIEYENGRVLGRKMSCHRGTTKVDSWWRYLFWHCSYCICLCDDQGPYSDRYFNMREVLADIAHNKVITGLKFVKVNKIIHLQIQEGTLLPFGKIDNETMGWKPVDKYKITDRNVKDGQDYHTMSWEKRDLDLDDLTAPDNYLLTGVRFRMIGTHLNLEIRATPFNFTTGYLVEPNLKSFWHSSDNTPLARSRLRMQNPDIPTRSHQPSVPDSKSDQYVEFTYTDYDRDAGQTTVPFIDTQPVTSDIPTPVAGAGIYHKGQPNFGGFVAPKIITYAYSRHLDALFPPALDINQHKLKVISIN